MSFVQAKKLPLGGGRGQSATTPLVSIFKNGQVRMNALATDEIPRGTDTSSAVPHYDADRRAVLIQFRNGPDSFRVRTVNKQGTALVFTSTALQRMAGQQRFTRVYWDRGNGGLIAETS